MMRPRSDSTGHRSFCGLALFTLLIISCGAARQADLPTYGAVVLQIGVPEGWEQEEPNRPNDVSRKLKSKEPFYLSLTIGHPSDSLYGLAYFSDYSSPGDVAKTFGTERIAAQFKALNADPRAEISSVEVSVDTLGGVPSLHMRTLTLMSEPYHEIVMHSRHIRVKEGWLYLAYAYEQGNEALALPVVQEVLDRLHLSR